MCAGHLASFLNNPLSSGFNSGRQKTFFLVFWTFQELRDSELSKLKAHVSEILRRRKWAKVGHQEVNKLESRGAGAPTPWGVPPILFWPSGLRFAPVLYPGSPYHEITYAIFFPRFIEAAAEAKVLSGRGQILLLRGHRRRGNPSHRHRHSS